MILQRTGDDLRRARAGAVDQHRQRQRGPTLRETVREHLWLRTRTRAQLDDALAAIEEQFGHGDALFEQAAGIAPQVHDERTRPELHHGIHGSGKLGRRLRAEHVHVHVAHTVLQQLHPLHGAQMHLVAHQREVHTGIATLHGEGDARSGRAAHRLRRFVARPAARRFRPYQHQPIADEDTGALRWATHNRLDDHRPAITDVDLQADARIRTADLLVQPTQAVFRQIRGVRVLQLTQQAGDGLLVDRAAIERVHILPRHGRDDLIEQASTTERRPRLRRGGGEITSRPPAPKGQQPHEQHARGHRTRTTTRRRRRIRQFLSHGSPRPPTTDPPPAPRKNEGATSR